jgi:hypothetical protein
MVERYHGRLITFRHGFESRSSNQTSMTDADTTRATVAQMVEQGSRKGRSHSTAEYHREWYARNKKKRISQVSACNTKLRERNIAYVYEHLASHPCVDCGEGDPIVLEFDHVRGSKVNDISRMARIGFSISKLAAEICKCEVRCANCHRRMTHKRRHAGSIPVGGSILRSSRSSR